MKTLSFEINTNELKELKKQKKEKSLLKPYNSVRNETLRHNETTTYKQVYQSPNGVLNLSKLENESQQKTKLVGRLFKGGRKSNNKFIIQLAVSEKSERNNSS